MKVKIIKEGSFTDAVDQMLGSDADTVTGDSTIPPRGAISTGPSRPKQPYDLILEEKGYVVGDELGKGMFGIVILATDPQDRDVAIKILKKGSGIAKGPMNAAFKREIRNYSTVQEARKQSKIVAKHFPKVFDIFTEGEYGFIVMELLTNKGGRMSLVQDIFQGREGLAAPTADAITQGTYKDVRRRMYTYLTNENSRNRIIDMLLDNVPTDIVDRIKSDMFQVGYLQHGSLENNANPRLLQSLTDRIDNTLLYTAQDAVYGEFGGLKKEFLSNPGLLIFLLNILERLKEYDIQLYYMKNVGIAMAWIDFIRKGSPIGIHNRPEMARADRGGAPAEVGDAIGEAASIRQAIEELERLTGLAGRDMHEGNVMIRQYTGDIVIVDLGLFKPRSEVVEERKKKRKKRRKRRKNKYHWNVGSWYYGGGYGNTDSGGDFGGDGGGGDGKRDDKKKIKVKIVKNLDERCQKGYKTHPTRKTKKMFGKQYRNCVKAEGQIEERELTDAEYNKKKEIAKAMKKDNPNMSDEDIYPIATATAKRVAEGDPKKGTGKKPKGSGRRLYTDEDPSDTVSVSFKSVSAIQKTLSKKSFKSKSHKRQSQIINLIHQRARAAYKNAKDPKVKARLKKAYEYAKKRKEASKKKTIRMRKKKK